MRTTQRMLELDIAVPRPTLTARLLAAWTAGESVWRAMRNRRAANRLADLDDFQLNDIGLSRSDIDGILRISGIADDPSQLLARTARVRSLRALRSEKSD